MDRLFKKIVLYCVNSTYMALDSANDQKKHSFSCTLTTVPCERVPFFDTGITNVLCHQLGYTMNMSVRGRRFEQFVILQIQAMIDYKRLDYQLSFWRTNHGSEVDLI